MHVIVHVQAALWIAIYEFEFELRLFRIQPSSICRPTCASTIVGGVSGTEASIKKLYLNASVELERCAFAHPHGERRVAVRAALRHGRCVTSVTGSISGPPRTQLF